MGEGRVKQGTATVMLKLVVLRDMVDVGWEVGGGSLLLGWAVNATNAERERFFFFSFPGTYPS